MSTPGAHSQSRRLPSEVDYIPRFRDLDPAQQQLRLRERQKFFEDVFQHDVDIFFPSSHVNIEHRRPPLDSISSMEVNVDMLEQIETFDINDQDSLDVFLSSATEDETDALAFPDFSSYKDETTVRAGSTTERKSCLTSLSTDLSGVDSSKEGAEMPSVQKEANEGHVGSSPSANSALEAKSQ